MFHIRKKCILICLIIAILTSINITAFADTCTVNTNRLILRQEATTKSKALQTLPRGTKLEIIKKNGKWYKVSYGKFTGYVYGKYVIKNKTTVNNKNIFQKGDKGEKIKTFQLRLKELGYYKATCDGNFGNVMITAVKKFQENNGLTVNGIIDKKTQQKLNSNSAINIQGITGILLDKSQTLKRGDNGSQVKALQRILKKLGYYTNSIDGNYSNRTIAAVSDFQEANNLKITGIANSTTIKKMLSSNALNKTEAVKREESKKIKTESLDWFKKGKSIFSGHPIVQIKDVRTGLIFKAKVLYTGNHLDLEPLTKEDTAILLKINGGEFTWHRRSMLVKYNNHVYAASIYSEPHGRQTILNNNFNGQFCLHFTGSKTNGTNEVKSDHQKCVDMALDVIW